MAPALSVDLDRNIKQRQFYDLAMNAAGGVNEYRHLFYGGAIRGGKTYVSLAILAHLAMKYPDSRWHIFRRDFPALESTTIPSFRKLIGKSDDWGWHRHRSNYYAYYKPNGSKIFFKGENIDRDPELNDLLGLETNGILFEQIEELSPQLWQMGCSRIGSWYIDDMPAPITLATFNPTQRWIKQFIYEPYVQEELKAPYFYQTALPGDNPYVTADQWKAWERLDERYQAQFIQGDWTDLTDRNNLWAYAFDREKHVGMPEYDRDKPLYISFDFNRNPICCSMIQMVDGQIRVLETIKMANANIYILCMQVRMSYPDAAYMITGDASGYNSTAMVQNNANYYSIIREQLHLAATQFQVPTINPPLSENQAHINALLTHRDIVIHARKAKSLIYDLEHVRQEPDGSIRKRDRRDPSQQADSLDTFRYWCNVFARDNIKEPEMLHLSLSA